MLLGSDVRSHTGRPEWRGSQDSGIGAFVPAVSQSSGRRSDFASGTEKSRTFCRGITRGEI
jgi:hypothetical protein